MDLPSLMISGRPPTSVLAKPKMRAMRKKAGADMAAVSRSHSLQAETLLCASFGLLKKPQPQPRLFDFISFKRLKESLDS